MSLCTKHVAVHEKVKNRTGKRENPRKLSAAALEREVRTRRERGERETKQKAETREERKRERETRRQRIQRSLSPVWMRNSHNVTSYARI